MHTADGGDTIKHRNSLASPREALWNGFCTKNEPRGRDLVVSVFCLWAFPRVIVLCNYGTQVEVRASSRDNTSFPPTQKTSAKTSSIL